MTLQVLRDDGAVIYLNGTQVASYSMPSTFNYRTYATTATDYTWDPAVLIPANLLVSGVNVLAVEIHQCNATSSDVSFNLVLTAEQLSGGTAPNVPVLISPNNGAAGVAVPATLQAQVSDPDNDALTVTFYGRKDVAAEPFTLLVLPDTQKYVASSTFAPIFTQQTQWIVNNRAELNIVAVTHEGDIVDTYNSTLQWDRANASLTVLDNAGMIYGLSPGNHDQPTTYFNQYFPPSRYNMNSWYGGNYPAGKNDNNFILFSAGGLDFLMLQIDFWPKADVIAWADGVLKAYPNRRAIITTHGFLGLDASRNVHVMGSTEYIWTDLVVPNPNVWFVLCGHVHGESRRTDIVNGHPVHQVLADYQADVNGGNGWLRIMQFVPPENMVYVSTYSPYLGVFQADADSQFALEFPMQPFEVIATQTGVSSGAPVSSAWPDVELNGDYEWFVTSMDPSGRTTASAIWSFSTTTDNTASVISAVMVSSITDRSAVITWTTDEPADSRVDYNTGITTSPAVYHAALVTQHSVQVDGLTADATYTFHVTSIDAAGNLATSQNHTFYTARVNQAPTAQSKLVRTGEDTALLITLSGTDPDGDSLFFQVITAPTHGTLTGVPPYLGYVPNLNWSGTDTFTYVASDGVNTSAAATVTITVTPVNEPPSAPVVSAAPADSSVALTWSASVDADGDPLTYTVWRSLQSDTGYGQIGSLTGIQYTDAGLQNGVTYYYIVRASDGSASTDSATVSAMPATPDYTAYVIANPALAYGTLSGAYTGTRQTGDNSSQALTETKVGQNATLDAVYTLQTIAAPNSISSLTLRLQAIYSNFSDPLKVYLWQNGAWTDISADILSDGAYLPVSPMNCVDSSGKILVRFTDSVSVRRENLDTLSIDLLVGEVVVGGSPANRPPVANNDTGTTAAETPLTLNVLANDTEPDNDPVTVSVATQPTNGAAVANQDGSIVYTPAQGFSGIDSFTYALNDGRGGVDTATVTVTVTGSGNNVISVARIDMSLASAGKSWKATGRVTIFDQLGRPVSGVSVTGDWLFNGNVLQTVTAVTDTASVSSSTSAPVKATSGQFVFRVTNLVLTGYQYAPSLNVEIQDSIGL